MPSQVKFDFLELPVFDKLKVGCRLDATLAHWLRHVSRKMRHSRKFFPTVPYFECVTRRRNRFQHFNRTANIVEPVFRLTGCLLCFCLADWCLSAFCAFVWLTDCSLTDSLTAFCAFVWLTDWLADWLTGWLAFVLLSGWLTDCLLCFCAFVWLT